MKGYVNRFFSIALSLAALTLLQACSGTPQSGSNVANAFQTSGTMTLQSYSRTIFSSTNF
jgi:outer membrane biogenesis lipoprotein LolB